MSRGGVSHYTSRNLDACTLQLGSWTPFLPSPSPLLPDSLSDSSSLPAPDRSGCGMRLKDADDRTKSKIVPSTSPAALQVSLRNACQRSLVRCTFKHVAGREEKQCWSSARTPDVRLRCQTAGKACDFSSWSLRAQSKQPTHSCERAGVAATGISDSSDGNRAPSSLPVVSPKHTSGWSKRQKQLSRALARGLWRWKEGNHARKRRRRTGGSCSCSGRSSGPASRMYASDPPTVGASAANATCSDFPFAGTDSSGELFVCGGGNESWDSEFSSLNEGVAYRRDGGEPVAYRRDGGEPYLSDIQNNVESGYGSEPGYRGGDELGYEDDGPPEEQDEEERDSAKITTRNTEAVTDASMDDIHERVTDPDAFDEDIVAELACSRISNEQKMHHRLRRRKQDWQKSRHPC